MKNTKKQQKKPLEVILESDDVETKKALFLFDDTDGEEEVLLKLNLWCRYFFPKFFSSEDAPFHKDIDRANINIYRRKKKDFINLAFRGGAKTTRTKLFIAFVIANDLQHTRKYFKILSYDQTNCKQFVTDLYNLLITVDDMYPELFAKTHSKREETMQTFTTSIGVKVLADTVGSSQRGSIQEEARPDFVVFDDFETRETLRSAVKTKAIWDNMQEAVDGLAVDGGTIYLGNYISEMGNVHRLMERRDETLSIALNVPIISITGELAWPDKYTKTDIDYLRKTSDDFEGEYLGRPDASKDIYFDRATLEAMPRLIPLEDISGFKIYREYKASHRYAGGMDIAGGVGLDSSTSVFIDFSTVPAQVVGTFYSNTIDPEAFGDEIYSESKMFGKCLIAPENNKFDQTILKARQLGANMHKVKRGKTALTITQSKGTPLVYGWTTNVLTKSNMMNDLRSAVNDGLINLNDEDLINECKSYTRNDLIDKEPDPRLMTRHFDLLIGLAIAWQLRDYAMRSEEDNQSPYSIPTRDESEGNNVAE